MSLNNYGLDVKFCGLDLGLTIYVFGFGLFILASLTTSQ